MRGNKNIGIMAAMVLIAIALGINTAIAAPATVSIGGASAAPGATTTVLVMANDVTDLATFDITVSYNPSVVIVTGATNNPDLGTGLNNLDDADEGWVRLANFNLVPAGEGLSGNVWISNITLEAVGNPGDESTLAITINTLSNSTEGTIPATPVNGEFTIPTLPPPPVYTTVSIDNVSAAPTETTTTLVTVNNVTDLATFDITVSYNPSVVIVTGATNNPGLGTNLNNLDDADEGRVRLANFNLVQAGEGLSGDIWISNITLEAVGNPGDESTLAITINTLSNSTEGAIPATPVNGKFTITPLDTTAPTAVAGSDQTVYVGDTVSFDGSGSTDNVGIVTYEWDFGDGSTGTGVTTTHIYNSAGTYTVTLTVTDGAGLNDSDTLTVTVNRRYVGGGGRGVPRDSDGDGYSDIDEMLAGTDKDDPCDPNPECAACLAIRPPTPTPVVTPTPTPVVTPTVVPPPVATPTPAPTPTPTPPGFEAVFAIAGLLAIAYLVLRRKRK